MDPNKFTTKSQEAITSAQSIASEYDQQQVDTLHLLLALLTQKEGVVLSILNKLDVQVDSIQTEIDDQIKKLQKVQSPEQMTGQVYLTAYLGQVL
ncbi:MAG: type VI secretion system ATPase TssH, partial [Candidatus Pacebacteria bacterium]|nr:type VI secretion system ATPase TssH [Candidatus Paceibacterota bacterium]